MIENNPLTDSAPFRHLTQLTIIRHILLGFLWVSIVIALWVEQAFMPLKGLSYVMIVFTILHALTFFRLRNNIEVTELEFFIQLLIDVIFLTLLFYFSGGANNPFISYLLIPICISATTLPWRYTCLITITCLVNYALLLFFYIHLPIFETSHQYHSENINWHIIGMWFNFSLSAILITYFIVKMARTIQEQNKTLSSMRENELRNQQLMAVAMLAAGAAHEMNTPLSTMTVLLSELKSEHNNNPHLLADLDILKSQVVHCATTLKQLVQDSNEANEGKFKPQNAKDFCNSIINRWQLMRPNIRFSLELNAKEGALIHDPRLDYAIINLLNNAADANPDNIKLEIYCEQNQLIWRIIDAGKGITQQLGVKLGKIMFSTKEQGLGIGMLLAHAAIKHYGGSVNHTPNANSGTTTELKLPLML